MAGIRENMRENNDFIPFLTLREAVRNGDWKGVKDFLEQRPDAVTAKIEGFGRTPLQVAILAGHMHIVKKLVERMSEEELKTVDDNGFTALAEATCGGNYQMAKCILKKNKSLVRIANINGELPVVLAIVTGHIELARYLYSLTPIEDFKPENSISGAALCTQAIHMGALGKSIQSASTSSPRYETRLSITDQVRNPERDDQVKHFGITGIKQLYEMKAVHAQSRELLQLMCRVVTSTSDDQQRDQACVYTSIYRSIYDGNVEFFLDMVQTNPELVWITEKANGRNILSYAIECRQSTIFNIICGLHEKNELASEMDFGGNTVLHLAGKLPDSTVLSRIPGAALKMQRELQWFKKVESIAQPKIKEHMNTQFFKPWQYFVKEHKNMMKDGERWMKDTATSCTVVGTLIATIMFAAVFTVPGGNNQTTGFPIFSEEKLFILFIVSDSLSLFSSSTSVLMFLGILTSRYAEDDFLKSLPTKMIIGLSTLLFSITTMMIAFSAAVLIILQKSWMVIPVIWLASVPVTLFVLMQFPLLVEMSVSTYGSIFDDKKKPLQFTSRSI
ncbi:ankyrin repeat-containing protein NPR4-like [Juglans microcarpa x Juglans regia]|uniref:ankyrin repeat-containing protein NPR4-like n=1 Tax=Juglans microcarpa x Juglans regia TaxID=2249226 RepID=UPI001B7D92AF|nr:ankyrin repeat-containing protein NPR4-like [Juglans microcarpa x Juglans regia]